jgi:putative restriction endonuclease
MPRLSLPMSESIDPPKKTSNAAGHWTREQLLLAFKFYCETPFGQLHSKNKKVVELASLIGRTPGALAMKCVNFASLDPAIRASGRSGLSNASALDRDVWDAFHADWNGLIEECDSLRAGLLREKNNDASTEQEDAEMEPDFTGETRLALVKQRVKQSFFRRAVLSSYGGKCCISGITDQRLLVASHIVPWSDDASIRLHPANGLCLSAIHDRAFDSHLFSLTDDHRIVLSTQLKQTIDDFLRQVFWPVDDKPIALPEKFSPARDFVARHRAKMLSNTCASP